MKVKHYVTSLVCSSEDGILLQSWHVHVVKALDSNSQIIIILLVEDVVGSAYGHFFSNDDQYLVYVKYNDTKVPLMSWPYYGPKEDVYGRTMTIAYPKVWIVADNQAALSKCTCTSRNLVGLLEYIDSFVGWRHTEWSARWNHWRHSVCGQHWWRHYTPETCSPTGAVQRVSTCSTGCSNLANFNHLSVEHIWSLRIDIESWCKIYSTAADQTVYLRFTMGVLVLCQGTLLYPYRMDWESYIRDLDQPCPECNYLCDIWPWHCPRGQGRYALSSW